MAVVTVFCPNSVATLMLPGRVGVKWCHYVET